jgi:hypothetical protein
MNKKDIALTTGGVLATMALAYMFYRLQQRDQAAAAAISAQAQADEAAAVPAADSFNVQNLYAESLSSLATPATSSVVTGTTTNVPASVASSAATSDLGFSYDSTATQHVLESIVAAFPAISAATADPGALELMQIPTIGSGVTQSSLNGIPLTAQEAAAQSLITSDPTTTTVPVFFAGGSGSNFNIGIGTASYSPSMETNWRVSSHPVTPHPIVTVQQ